MGIEETALELCRGQVNTICSAVSGFVQESISEYRGRFHPIKRFETRAEKVGLEYLLTMNKLVDLKIALGYELKDKWTLIENEESTELSVDELLVESPDLFILSDPIDGSKADIRSYGNAVFGDPSLVFSTAIAFKQDDPTLNGAIACAMQNWDGRSFYTDGESAKIGIGKLEVGSPQNYNIKELDQVLKIYFGEHYLHGAIVGNFIREKLLENLDFEEWQSPGLRATGSTTAEILKAVETRAISFDLRNEFRLALEEFGRTANRGCYSHDLAAPCFYAKKAGLNVLDPNSGEDLDFRLLNYDRHSYFVAPESEVSDQILGIIQDEVLPGFPKLANKYYHRFPKLK
jgi:hypothetical protein